MQRDLVLAALAYITRRTLVKYQRQRADFPDMPPTTYKIIRTRFL